MTRPTTTGKAQDLITFTRSTTGTYLGSDGLLKSAAIDEARIEYDASGNCLGLLVEEQRTNKVPYSQDYTNDNYWSKQEVTVATAPVAAPDGTMTATHVVKTGSNGHLVDTNIVTTSDRHSIWARSVSGTGTIHIAFQASASLVTLTEEWQRFDVQCNNNHVYAVNFRGDATLTECYVWGSQAETGTFPTSYIPTSGSAVTRAADVASLAVSKFGYNQDQGTVVAEAAPSDISSGGRVFSLNDGTGSNVVRSQAQNSNHFIVISGGAVQGNIDAGTFANNTFSTLSGAYKQNDIAACIDGGAVVTDTSATIPTITNLSIGQRYDGNNKINGHIKSIQYYPLRLSNAQLQALTV